MVRSKDRWLENIQADDVENVEWIDSLTEVELKKELLERVKLVGTLRQHRDTLLGQLGLFGNALMDVVSNEEIGTRVRDRVIGQLQQLGDAYRVRGMDAISIMADNLQAGDQVYWRDPDDCVASGYGTFIKHINEEVARIMKDDVEIEVFITELSLAGQ